MFFTDRSIKKQFDIEDIHMCLTYFMKKLLPEYTASFNMSFSGEYNSFMCHLEIDIAPAMYGQCSLESESLSKILNVLHICN